MVSSALDKKLKLDENFVEALDLQFVLSEVKRVPFTNYLEEN